MRIRLNELLFALSRALDFVEQELLGIATNHGKRIAFISARICRALGLRAEDIFDMAGCAILHDNALTAYMQGVGPEGYRLLEQFEAHCPMGESNALAFPFAGDVSGVILHHHENWNGTGFHGLAGTDIPLRSRILRLADNMDLMLRMGDGRDGLADEIRRHAREEAGSFYDPAIVDTLLGLLTPQFLRELQDEHVEDSLKNELPPLRIELSSQQMLQLCSLVSCIIDAKSTFTKNHSSGVAHMLGRLAQRYGISPEHRDKLMIAGYLHDVGKLSVPLSILEKAGPLSEDEVQIMRRHAVITEAILAQVRGLEDVAIWGAYHHEKLDGRGYPYGRKRQDLPFESRLLTCCDIYQALTENRPYRQGMAHEQAIAIMKEMAVHGEIDSNIVRAISEEYAKSGPVVTARELAPPSEAERAYA